MSAILHQPVSLTAEEADDLAERFEPLGARELLAWAVDRFDGRVAMTCSWQRQSSVLVHLLAELGARVRIVEIDTGLLFPESHAVRERLVERYGIEVETVRPRRTLEEQAAVHGDRLWERDPERCCQMRKVAPLERVLADADAWITGIRREQSVSRRSARKVQLDPVRGVVKVQPLVDWTAGDVASFVERHAIPVNPLHDLGFPSIGCMPCTRRVRAGEDERAGRWSGTAKTECGLHTP